jgi:hypothetical protein
VAVRLNTVLRDWLGQWGLAGVSYWVVWGLLAAGGGLAYWLAWRRGADEVYLAALAGALGLVLTPYALQYDYPPLALALFWIYDAWSPMRLPGRWIVVAVLLGVFSVPFWERPVYDGYWIALGIAGLLIALPWSRPMWVLSRDRQ